MRSDGLLYCSTPAATVGLIVLGGIVVETPPYAHSWAQGKDARELWRRMIRQGATLRWLPDEDR